MKTPAEVVATYREHGFVVLPARWPKKDSTDPSDGKYPTVKWEVYQDRAPTDEEYERWFAETYLSNFWLLCGRASRIVVLDIDDKAGQRWAEETVGKDVLDATTCVRTKKGRHYYFSIPGDAVVPSWSLHKTLGVGVDFRAEGTGVVAPPSMHKSGAVYGFVRDLECLQPLPDVLRDFSPQSNGKSDTTTTRSTLADLLANPAREGGRNDWLTRVAGHLAKQMPHHDAYLESVRLAAGTLHPPLAEPEVAKTADSIWKAERRSADARLRLTFHDCSDDGNGQRFAEQHGGVVRYLPDEERWLHWDGRRWARDDAHAVEELMAQTTRNIHHEAADCADDGLRKRLASWAITSGSAARRLGALTCARSIPSLVVRSRQLDVDPYRLTVLNGTIDLRTGELRAHDQADLITRCAPVVFEGLDVHSDVFDEFLADTTQGDTELWRWLQRAAGMSLTGLPPEHLIFLLGGTETGKSTLAGALHATLGADYAMTANQESLLRRDRAGGPREGIADMEGRRLVTVPEFDRSRSLDEPLLKMLTGGDEVRLRNLYSRERGFRFTAKIWIHTNYVPKLTLEDEAIWRRILVAPLIHRVPAEKRDPAVKATLCDPAVSGAAILAWAVKGCLDFGREGLGTCEAVAKATARLRVEMDPLAEFFDDVCVFGDEHWTAAGALHSAYVAWAEANDIPERMRVGPRLRKAGLQMRGCEEDSRRFDGKKCRGWAGVALSGVFGEAS